MIALRRDYLGGVDLGVELVADDVPYRLILSRRNAEIGRGTVRNPGLRIRGPGTQIARLFLDPKSGSLVKAIEIEGPDIALETLLTSFGFPRRDLS